MTLTLSRLEKPLVLEAREARSAPSLPWAINKPLASWSWSWPSAFSHRAPPCPQRLVHTASPPAVWWCSHYWVMWGITCHFCLIGLKNLLSLMHLRLLQRGVDALQMRGISFPCSLLHGNLIRFCMTDHRKQQKVWRSFLLEQDKRNTRIKTSREQKEQSWLKGYSTGSNSLLHVWLFNNSDIL